jgi:hypothetical protein
MPPPTRLSQLTAELAEPKPMRCGTLSEGTIKCSKAGRRCAEAPKGTSRPYFGLTRAAEDRTHSRFLTPEQARLRPPTD